MNNNRKIIDDTKNIRKRQYEIVTNLVDENGNEIISEEDIENILLEHNCWLKYVYIIHSNCYHTEDEVKKNNKKRETLYKNYFDKKRLELLRSNSIQTDIDSIAKKYALDETNKNCKAIIAGQRKAKHIHILLQFYNSRYIKTILNWFNLKTKLVYTIDDGEFGFYARIKYILHEDCVNKTGYDISQLHASFDVEKFLAQQENRRRLEEKYNVTQAEINECLEKVALHNISEDEITSKITVPIFNRHKKEFDKARQYYIKHSLPMPQNRFVIFIDYEDEITKKNMGGTGKSSAADYIALYLAKEFISESAAINSDNIYDFINDNIKNFVYRAGKGTTAFQNYQGEPIIIFNECKANSLVKAFQSLDEIKEFLDLYPKDVDYKKLFGEFSIKAKYVIINGIEKYEQFANVLMKTSKQSEDLTQIYRRLPICVRLHKKTIEILTNEGALHRSDDPTDYTIFKTKFEIAASMKWLSEHRDKDSFKSLQDQLMSPIINELYDLFGILTQSKEDDLPPDNLNWGQILYKE